MKVDWSEGGGKGIFVKDLFDIYYTGSKMIDSINFNIMSKWLVSCEELKKKMLTKIIEIII